MSDFCCISLSQNALDYRMIMDLVPVIFLNVNYFFLRSMGSCLSVELKTDGNSALQCMCLKVVVVNNCNADLMDCFFVLFFFFSSSAGCIQWLPEITMFTQGPQRMCQCRCHAKRHVSHHVTVSMTNLLIN